MLNLALGEQKRRTNPQSLLTRELKFAAFSRKSFSYFLSSICMTSTYYVVSRFQHNMCSGMYVPTKECMLLNFTNTTQPHTSPYAIRQNISKCLACKGILTSFFISSLLKLLELYRETKNVNLKS
jgi:hypothetical protein